MDFAIYLHSILPLVQPSALVRTILKDKAKILDLAIQSKLKALKPKFGAFLTKRAN